MTTTKTPPASNSVAGDRKYRQHHVWQYYLKSWTTENSLFCRMEDRIFQTGTSAVAVENLFYRFAPLTEENIALIRFLLIDVPNIHPLTRKNHEQFLAMLALPGKLLDTSALADDFIETFQINALEDYHASIEAAFIPLLDRLLKRDTSFINSTDESVTLFHYLATQHMRTKGIREKTVAILREKNGLDVAPIWSILSHMLAFNVGMSLFLERRKLNLTLLENRTGRAFITGDQPIVNLNDGKGKPPDSLSWFYPIAPDLALLLPAAGEAPYFTSATLTDERVGHLNTRIMTMSHGQIFGRSREDLQGIR